MKAVFLEKKGGAESLVAGEIPRPKPKAGEVLVQVYATAIMPTELDWELTFNQPSGEPRPFPIVLSHEFSGVVEALGANVSNVNTGDEVYGVNDWYINGAQAEYCVVAATALTRKPKSLRHVESAVVPISALTAWQGLFEKCQLERGQRVLIHGGSGAVGTFAVQLARWRGANVTVTASPENLEFVRALGADKVIDYHTTRFEDVVCDMDVIFDGVGGDTLERSWSILKSEGRLVSVATVTKPSPNQRSREAFMLVRTDAQQLTQLGRMIDAGELRVFVEEVYPLATAKDAYAHAKQGKMRGKVALTVIEQPSVDETAKNF